jgi:hypothetical protein
MKSPPMLPVEPEVEEVEVSPLVEVVSSLEDDEEEVNS